MNQASLILVEFESKNDGKQQSSSEHRYDISLVS